MDAYPVRAARGIKIAFGGMTAEELFFGEAGTGPSGDLAHATRVAAQMVGSFGMAGSLVSLEAVEAGPITQGIVGKVLANDDSRNAVERILDQAKDDVRVLLDENRHLVIALRDALLQREELVGDEISTRSAKRSTSTSTLGVACTRAHGARRDRRASRHGRRRGAATEVAATGANLVLVGEDAGRASASSRPSSPRSKVCRRRSTSERGANPTLAEMVTDLFPR